MKDHIAYLKYVIRHKWFVLHACQKWDVPLWRGIVHDWTKFLPREWFPYVRAFYNPDGSKRDTRTDSGTLDSNKVAEDFALAWLHHQKSNPHHWQYWLLVNDEDGIAPLKMPEVYVREMLADWEGAGRAITGTGNPAGWFIRQAGKIILHPETDHLVQELLGVAPTRCE